MMYRFCKAALVAPVLLAAAASAPPPAAAATLILSQSVCPVSIDGCKRISYLDSSWIVRTFTFTLPAAGRAALTFEGSMQCSNRSYDISSNNGVVDLSGAILADPKATPSVSVPSFVRISQRIPARPDISAELSSPIMISTTRVIGYTSGGRKSVTFKLIKNRMDSLTGCTVFTGSFHGIFTSDR